MQTVTRPHAPQARPLAPAAGRRLSPLTRRVPALLAALALAACSEAPAELAPAPSLALASKAPTATPPQTTPGLPADLSKVTLRVTGLGLPAGRTPVVGDTGRVVVTATGERGPINVPQTAYSFELVTGEGVVRLEKTTGAWAALAAGRATLRARLGNRTADTTIQVAAPAGTGGTGTTVGEKRTRAPRMQVLMARWRAGAAIEPAVAWSDKFRPGDTIVVRVQYNDTATGLPDTLPPAPKGMAADQRFRWTASDSVLRLAATASHEQIAVVLRPGETLVGATDAATRLVARAVLVVRDPASLLPPKPTEMTLVLGRRSNPKDGGPTLPTPGNAGSAGAGSPPVTGLYRVGDQVYVSVVLRANGKELSTAPVPPQKTRFVWSVSGAAGALVVQSGDEMLAARAKKPGAVTVTAKDTHSGLSASIRLEVRP